MTGIEPEASSTTRSEDGINPAHRINREGSPRTECLHITPRDLDSKISRYRKSEYLNCSNFPYTSESAATQVRMYERQPTDGYRREPAATQVTKPKQGSDDRSAASCRQSPLKSYEHARRRHLRQTGDFPLNRSCISTGCAWHARFAAPARAGTRTSDRSHRWQMEFKPKSEPDPRLAAKRLSSLLDRYPIDAALHAKPGYTMFQLGGREHALNHAHSALRSRTPVHCCERCFRRQPGAGLDTTAYSTRCIAAP